MATTYYQPHDTLTNDGTPLTWSELWDLVVVYWHDVMGEDTPTALRELSDGRVVDADWNPADGDPVVWGRAVPARA